LEDKSGMVVYNSTDIQIDTIRDSINQMGFEATCNQTIVDIELGGIADDNIPIAIERISSIDGVFNVQFPLKNDSTHAKITYNQNQIDAYSLYQKIQSIGYKVQPTLENISRAFLRVQGMHCNSCVMNITQTVEDLPGIHDVKVSFDDQSAKILYDPGIIDLSEIIKEIEKLDFQVANAPNSEGEKSKGILFNFSKHFDLVLFL
jgi:Cu+-exporting ATPase